MMFAAISAAGATMSPAATWSGGGTTDSWTQSANWGGSSPPSNLSTAAIFTGSTRTTPDATLGICSSITFNASAASFTLGPSNGGGGLQIGSGGVTNNSANAQSIMTSTFLQASQTWTNNGGLLSSADYLNINTYALAVVANQPVNLSALWGSGTITKTGTATLSINPTLTSSSFSGGTLIINEGAVELSKTGQFASNIGNIVIGDGTGSDTLKLMTAGALSGPSTTSVTINSSGVLDLNNNTSSLNALTFAGGSAQIGTTGTRVLQATAISSTASSQTAVVTGAASQWLITNGQNITVADGSADIDLDFQVRLEALTAGARWTKLGAGTLRLGATALNAGQGTTLGAGRLLFADDGSLGSQQFTFAGGILSPHGGSRTISNSMNITGAATIDTAGLDLTVNNTIAGAGSLTKAGAGTLSATHVRTTGSLTVSAGTLRPTGAGTAGTSQVGGVSITTTAGGGRLDLRDKKLIVTAGAVGSWDGAQYTGLTGLIQSGRGDGTWNGNGLVTSETAATSSVLTTLAVALASDVGYAGVTFGGVSVTASDALVMYTWGGDADLNGELNGDDYFAIDSHVLQSGSVFGFHNGDFDYNGQINGDDYFILDSNILQAQSSGNTFWARAPEFSDGGGLAAVPEPGSIGLIGLAATGMLARRRRR